MIKLKKLFRWCLWVFIIFLGAIAGLIVADSLHTKSCPEPDMKGKIVEIPGERIEFLNSVNETDRQILYTDCVRDPPKDSDYRPTSEDGHIHPQQEERFEVIEGRAQFLIGDRQIVLAPGEVGVVPPNTIHNWIALDGKPVRVKAHFSPALDTGPWFLSFHGQLAKGDMNLLQAAVICSEFKKGTPMPADLHPIIFKMLVKVLAPIGRLIGYKAC